jgi:hypothetical protein
VPEFSARRGARPARRRATNIQKRLWGSDGIPFRMPTKVTSVWLIRRLVIALHSLLLPRDRTAHLASGEKSESDRPRIEKSVLSPLCRGMSRNTAVFRIFRVTVAEFLCGPDCVAPASDPRSRCDAAANFRQRIKRKRTECGLSSFAGSELTALKYGGQGRS